MRQESRCLGVLVLLATFSSSVALAQSHDPNDYEKILVPVNAGHYDDPVQGANGSMWRSLPFLRNDADVAVFFFLGDVFTCRINECPPLEPVPAKTTVELVTMARSTFDCADPLEHPELCLQYSGNLYYAEKTHASAIHILTRVWDDNDPEAVGAYVPSVPESTALRTTTSITGLQISPGARFRIRLYDFENRQQGRQFTIAAYAFAQYVLAGEKVGEVTITTRPGEIDNPGFPYWPGFFEADLRELFPAIATGTLLRLEVTPADDAPFWFFVSATSADSTHISIATP